MTALLIPRIIIRLRRSAGGELSRRPVWRQQWGRIRGSGILAIFPPASSVCPTDSRRTESSRHRSTTRTATSAGRSWT